MQVSQDKHQLHIQTASYRFICPADRPFVYVQGLDGQQLAELFIASSVHSTSGLDDTTGLDAWDMIQGENGITLTRQAHSSIWRSKMYRFRLSETCLHYEVEVEGEGRVTAVDYFGGYYSGQPRWGSGYFWSAQRFQQGFNPEPTMAETYHFAPGGSSVIDLTGVPLPNKGSWFYTPPPFCFAFETTAGWLSMGVEAQPGRNHYCEYAYRGQHDAFKLGLDYAGYLQISGTDRLPTIGMYFDDDPYGAIEAHVEALRASGMAPTVQQPKAAWWREPIFCGWGAQCGIARNNGGRAPDYARQVHYEGFLHTLEAQGISPGTVVIDDKWQAAYGDNIADSEKWPDLPGFIAQQHHAGRKVLLWLKAWDPEGLPADECVTNNVGEIIAADMTNPAYERRLREAVERMISPQGYDADGFKIDFTARIPASPGLRSAGDVWGLELMRRYLEIVYASAKRIKPDALVIAHTPHPYLADVVDMIRLNDINIGKDVNMAMQHRARIAAIACPDSLIDTDNWPMTNRATWRRYLPLQLELGVPALYFATQIDTTGEMLEDEDYTLLRDLWSQYRMRMVTSHE